MIWGVILVNIKSSRKRSIASPSGTELLFAAISFLLGVAAYLLFSKTLLNLSENDFSHFGAIFPAVCCMIFLIITQLSSFSVLGIFLIPAADFLFGAFISAVLEISLPAGADSLLILKASLIVFAAVLSGIAISVGSFKSSLRLFRRLRGDKYVRTDYIKLFLLCAIAVVLFVVGFADL